MICPDLVRCPLAPTIRPIRSSCLARIETDDRLVVLARTMHLRDPGMETALKDSAVNWARFGGNMPRTGALSAPRYLSRTPRNPHRCDGAISELSYFRSLVPERCNIRPRGQATTGDVGLASRRDSPDDRLVLHPSARLAGLNRSAGPGRHITGVHPGRTCIFRRVPGCHAGLLWPCCREACPRQEEFGTFRAMETAAYSFKTRRSRSTGTRFTCASWRLTAFADLAGSSRPPCERTRRTPLLLQASSPVSIVCARFPVGLSTIPLWKQTLQSRRKAERNRDRRSD